MLPCAVNHHPLSNEEQPPPSDRGNGGRRTLTFLWHQICLTRTDYTSFRETVKETGRPMAVYVQGRGLGWVGRKTYGSVCTGEGLGVDGLGLSLRSTVSMGTGPGLDGCKRVG